MVVWGRLRMKPWPFQRRSQSIHAITHYLAALDADQFTYGLAICKATGYPGGTVYPIIHRLADAGWLVVEWERMDPHEVGRPPRRLIKLATDARDCLIPLGEPR